MEPAEGGNQPKRVKVTTNNVSNQVFEWVRVVILRTSPSNCSYCSKEVCVSLTRGVPPDGAAPREEIVFNECNRKEL